MMKLDYNIIWYDLAERKLLKQAEYLHKFRKSKGKSNNISL
ncbi:Uncharacterised protein [Actinobacillus porcinus]|uniref:Uncharacterized protein n=1 Tax=Actinobacillus porcinus TaxID=51048 RepID=A0ABY6TP83_9PAST|nr:hypothetical protein [Actinobacillus porcinus]VFY94107.1 Uncharacterised protein [Actinobacillus porcinus]VTU09726.1 Uncharacterised protein [Actinobacillus porcinus]